jgi:adenylate cyclase
MARLLISTPDDRQEVYSLESEVLTIGRAEDNHLSFPDDALVSSWHASITQRHGDFWIHDLRSHNGTFVNQMMVEQKRLEEGDKITIGGHTLVFTKHTGEKKDSPVQTKFRMEQFEGNAIWMLLEDDLTRTLDYRFEVLRQVVERLGRVVERKTLREAVKDSLYQAFHPERAELLLTSPDYANLVPEASYSEASAIIVSERTPFIRSLVDQVIREKSPLLTYDVQEEVASDLRSVLCVPLLQDGRAIGVVYVDDSRQSRRFTNDDLELLIAIGSQVSQVVERVRIHEQLQREALLRNHLERFVAPSVVEEIIWQTDETGRPSPTAEEREVTILFSDIKNFTPLAARMRPAEVAQLLNRYLTEMTDVLFNFGGTLDKYIGDGIMAIFGSPIAHPNHAERAVRAALAMLDRHGQLMAETPDDERFTIRIGVNTGPAVVGFIGTQKRLEYTAIGNTVNVASRLESAADPNNVWIGGPTLRHLIVAQHADPAKTWKIEEGFKIDQDTWVQVEFKGKQLIKNIEVEAYSLVARESSGGSPS